MFQFRKGRVISARGWRMTSGATVLRMGVVRVRMLLVLVVLLAVARAVAVLAVTTLCSSRAMVPM